MTVGAISGYGMYGNYNYALSNASAISSPEGEPKDGFSVTGEEAKKVNGKSSPEECQTCKDRKYVDGSDEMNVSFKSAAHVSPGAASAAVRTHESEHVSNAYSKAEEKDGKVVSANVAIHTAVCPECGRTYVSGGTTTTQIKYGNESNPYQKNFKSADAAKYTGNNLDYIA